jgi:hypothetical protein
MWYVVVVVVVVYQVSLWCLARKVVLLVEEKQLVATLSLILTDCVYWFVVG